VKYLKCALAMDGGAYVTLPQRCIQDIDKPGIIIDELGDVSHSTVK
jgi:hypothetical protein